MLARVLMFQARELILMTIHSIVILLPTRGYSVFMTSELILQDSELIIQDSELILQDSELILHDSELIWYSRIVSWYSNIVSWYSRILSWYSRILSWYSKLNIGAYCMYSVLDCCLLCLFAFYNSYMYSKIELCSCSSEVSSERKSFDRYGFWSL